MNGAATIRLRFSETNCFMQFDRPAAGNAVNRQMIDECHRAVDLCLERGTTVLVLRGSRQVFCSGADFTELSRREDGDNDVEGERLYQLWRRLAEAAFVTVSQVEGRVIGGGMGFVAASDIVIAEPTASFALPELLFGLFPACVLPFLVRRIGFQRAHYMAVTTRSVPAELARDWGLVDDYGLDSDELLRKHLLRLRRLSRATLERYKQYSFALDDRLAAAQTHAVHANRDMFSDPENRSAIARYAAKGLFPWEADGNPT
jgi:polyketide biosynthesis enoyl-CoA hydratase PksH